ncbi:sensor histidine kinase [Microseira wollei]|uniref:histidine kinase n=1 Tax=Microseira wollei NIES-4236 TaxID=2530354 RepID=A0AAV3XRK4_9CYAN|nr:HAMP domain-containing sensor histidine kinase [Microseira wollei]GET44428.1 integral membrane sensor signal transduction histidine kinase [Microseira wollei NIES-4236]
MFQATRRRLALWYTAVTAVVLLLFATGVYMYVRSTLIERVDDTLNHVVEVVVRSLVIDPVNSAGDGKLRINLEASFPDNADTVEDDRIDLEWFSPTGELLWSTFSFPLNIPIHLNRTGETVRVVRWAGQQRSRGAEGQGSRGNVPVLAPTAEENYQSKILEPKSKIEPSTLVLRQVTERVEMGRQVLGYLRVSHPWFEVTKPSRQLIFDLSLGIGLMVISVAAIGWFLSGLAMKPVGESYQRLKQFTADASHELRSPIATIQTNVQVALADPDLEPQMHRQQLQVIERLTQRLGRLVDDLLFLARQDSGMVQPCFTPVPLDALLMEAIEEQRLVAASKNINLSLDLVEPPTDITTDMSEEIYTLEGDWDQLARLFTNLVGNAVQYTLPGGRVDVELQQIGRHNHTQLQVKVKDTGIGIPEDALAHLFDRFYRVDPARSRALAAGSGLGLAIASAIVENHKGHIRVESTLDRGTTFTVILPRRVGEQVSK